MYMLNYNYIWTHENMPAPFKDREVKNWFFNSHIQMRFSNDSGKRRNKMQDTNSHCIQSMSFVVSIFVIQFTIFKNIQPIYTALR